MSAGLSQRLRSIKELASPNSPFSEASLRWMVFQAEQNGLGGAIVRVGRRVLIDVDAFDEWLASGRSISDEAPAS